MVTYLRELLESNARLADIWIAGEVSNLSRSSAGHYYFTLKDSQSQLRCVLFAGRAALGMEPQDGNAVVAHGLISIYAVRGDLQFVVDFVQPEGMGVLAMEFERRKAALEAEGLFAPERKRPLPLLPRRLGVVTSPTGAVLQDIIHIVRRRYPLVELVLAPTPVQGDGAAPGIVRALEALSAEEGIDAVILARGGGSLEELWAFNEETVARAIFACRHPVVSGVGHETDFTIADFVADVRAPTPSAAAELAVPDSRQLLAQVASWEALARGRIAGQASRALSQLAAAVTTLRRSLPSMDGYRHATFEREASLHRQAQALLGFKRESARAESARLAALDPQATLARGYAIISRQDDGSIVSRQAQVSAGDGVSVWVSDGSFPARVEPNGAATS